MKTLLIAFILIATHINILMAQVAQDCLEYQTKIIFDQKPVMDKEILCKKKTPDKTVYYVSKSCLNDACSILKQKKNPLTIPKQYSNFGSPGFKLCFALGGVPQIFEFQRAKNEWESSERCFFEKDFVEISLLRREWKGFVNR